MVHLGKHLSSNFLQTCLRAEDFFTDNMLAFSGRVVVRTIGGGMKRWFRWIDYKRTAPETGPPLQERVYQVRYDPCRTARLALVASGGTKRWLVASEGIKAGDIITTSGHIPRIPGLWKPHLNL